MLLVDLEESLQILIQFHGKHPNKVNILIAANTAINMAVIKCQGQLCISKLHWVR